MASESFLGKQGKKGELFPAVKHMQLEKDSGKCGHILFRNFPLIVGLVSKWSTFQCPPVTKCKRCNLSHASFVSHMHHWLTDRWWPVGLSVDKHCPPVVRLRNFTDGRFLVTIVGSTVGCNATGIYNWTLYHKFGALHNLEIWQNALTLLCIFFTQTTGARAKPEEEKEDEVASRTLCELPQVPLCHIVTPLVLFFLFNAEQT